MSGRAAFAAAQSAPDRNVQFRRFRPDGATGLAVGHISAWWAPDVRPPAMSAARRLAEAWWEQITRRGSP
jgi:hypothetical protein